MDVRICIIADGYFLYWLWSKSLISIVEVSMQEAKLAKEKMHGRLACGRPLHLIRSGMGQTSRSAKIAAIKNKLKSLEEGSRTKKQKQNDDIS
ncbi:hypothetical protein Ahy_B05g073925 [Arachis hypogaea]|uniref:Uncharacterized protein n=1 Tax=Arachis hypogaea TaxID=3818 RepID=A0A444YXJ0_ARAHY|nr:hypothetical protein Ahy_B05g073925 [Arachis hypogaea]